MLSRHLLRMHPFPLGYPRVLDLQTSFWMASHWVWERRATSKQTFMPYGEETITETVLLDLATQHPKELKIFPLNKAQEGKVGADWEWCFYNKRRTRFQPMLVQAKLLDDRDHEYSHIDRFIGSTGVRQIDRLLETSRRRRVPAVYVFYNHLKDSDRAPRVCGSFDCAECWGCSVAMAEAVRAGLPKKDFDTISRHSKPWVCLLCRGGSAEGDAPSRALSTLQDLFRRSQRLFREEGVPFENATNPPESPSSEPPSYFKNLMLLDEVDSPVERQAIIGRTAEENPDIDGIVLVSDHLEERKR